MFLNKETKIKPIEETLETKQTSYKGEVFYDFPLTNYKSGTYNLIFNAEGLYVLAEACLNAAKEYTYQHYTWIERQ